MKIALVTAFPRDLRSPKGGVESVSVNLALALARIPGNDVHVVTTERGLLCADQMRERGITIHRLPHSNQRTLIDALGAGRRDVRRAVARIAPDVLHSHDTYGLMVRGMELPRVFTVHGFIHADTLVSGERFARLRSIAWRHVEQAGWEEQPHIVSISPYVRERISTVTRGVIHDIDNPVAESFFDIERDEEPGTIFSAAHICRRKNTLGLVEALGRLRSRGVDCTLHLAGAVLDQEYGDRVRARIGQLELGGRVRLLGSIGREEIARELSQASVFALGSLEEGAPLCIEEAMAAGVPVVASNRCGMPYMVQEGATGWLVDPLDPEDFASRLASIILDPTLRAAMGERSRRVARERFHPDVVARKTLAVYERAVRGTGAAWTQLGRGREHAAAQ